LGEINVIILGEREMAEGKATGIGMKSRGQKIVEGLEFLNSVKL